MPKQNEERELLTAKDVAKAVRCNDEPFEMVLQPALMGDRLPSKIVEQRCLRSQMNG